MRIKTKDLSGVTLDYAVSMVIHPNLVWGETIGLSAHCHAIVIPEIEEPDCWSRPSTNWAQAGEIIEREGISVKYLTITDAPFRWAATQKPTLKQLKPNAFYGETTLIAAMRCYVASKLGDEVEIPEELI